MEHLPRSARPSKVLWINMRWLQQTPNEIESTKLIPIQVPNRTFLMKMVSGSSTSFSNSTKRLYFRIAHPVRFVPMLVILVFKYIFFLCFGKFLAKIISHTINIRNFSL